jgi:hypothetical protein
LFEKKCRECHHPDTNDDFPYLHETISIGDLLSEEAIIPIGGGIELVTVGIGAMGDANKFLRAEATR